MTDDGFELVKPLRITDRLALTSYDIRFTDGQDQAVLGIAPVLWQFVKDSTSSVVYDLGLSVKIIADDHPRLSGTLRPVSRWLGRVAYTR